MRASALQITLISLSAVLLTMIGSAGKNEFQQKPAEAVRPTQNARGCAAVSAPNKESKRPDVSNSARVEFSASRQCVGGHEIAGFSAPQAQEENVTPPAGLNSVEQEAWLAMAQRQAASSGTGFKSFYPARYGEAFVVENQGVRVAVRPLGASDVAARIDNGQVIYREAYPEADSVHLVGGGRSEEFLYL